MITPSGQRNLCTISGRRWHSIFSIFLFSLYHICDPAKSCYLFICSDSGNYPFLLNLTAKSLRVNQGLGTMSFSIRYCILVHLCGSALLSELSSELKSFPADPDHASRFLKSLYRFLLLSNSVFSSSPTSLHTALPKCTPSACLTLWQAWCIILESWWVYHLVFQHNLVSKTTCTTAKCKGKVELGAWGRAHSALQEGVETSVFHWVWEKNQYFGGIYSVFRGLERRKQAKLHVARSCTVPLNVLSVLVCNWEPVWWWRQLWKMPKNRLCVSLCRAPRAVTLVDWQWNAISIPDKLQMRTAQGQWGRRLKCRTSEESAWSTEIMQKFRLTSEMM